MCGASTMITLSSTLPSQFMSVHTVYPSAIKCISLSLRCFFFEQLHFQGNIFSIQYFRAIGTQENIFRAILLNPLSGLQSKLIFFYSSRGVAGSL